MRGFDLPVLGQQAGPLHRIVQRDRATRRGLDRLGGLRRGGGGLHFIEHAAAGKSEAGREQEGCGQLHRDTGTLVHRSFFRLLGRDFGSGLVFGRLAGLDFARESGLVVGCAIGLRGARGLSRLLDLGIVQKGVECTGG